MFGRNYLSSEYSRISGKKLHGIFFILFAAALSMSLQFGLARYRHFNQEKKLFSQYKQDKLDRWAKGDHSRPEGFSILYAPSPLSVLFFSHGVFNNLSVRIDSTGAITFTDADGAWPLFFKQGFFPDPAGLFYLLGSLLMVYFGLTAYIGGRHFFRPGCLLARMAILDIFFLLFLAGLYASLSLWGITLNGPDTALFLSFAFYFIIFADLFFAIGAFSRLVCARKQTGTIAGLVSWFLLVWLLPAAINYAGQTDGSLGQDMEKSAGYYERLYRFIPTAYYPFLAGEISGQGFRCHLRFTRYAWDQRRRFAGSSLEHPEKENIFPGSGNRPGSFWLALGLTALYGLILLLLSSFLILRRARRAIEKRPYEGTFWPDPVKPGDICYVFCYSEETRDKFFASVRGEETISISRIDPQDFDPDMKLKDLFLLSRPFIQTDEKRFQTYLEKLGIAPPVLEKRISQVPFGQFKNFYAGLIFSNYRSTILINDYFRGAERDYNRRLQELLAHISREEGKTIIVFSVDMFDPLAVYLQARGMDQTNDYRVFQVGDITGIDL